VKSANAKGIKIGHTPGVLSDAVADTTVMLVLMTMRRVEEGIQLIKSDGVCHSHSHYEYR
jgi:glyoxylate/hydroxypyruvate reductase